MFCGVDSCQDVVQIERIAKTQNENILNIWVPGQYADGMSTTELTNAIRYCDVLIGNAHEIAYIRKMLPEGQGRRGPLSGGEGGIPARLEDVRATQAR